MQVIFETGPKGSAALFSKPVNMILARHSSEVDAALDRMDAALDDGFWIAGYFSYELGYAIEPKLLNLMPKERRIPLISLGVYDRPKDKPNFDETEVWFGQFTPEWSAADYHHAFEKVHGYISAGDIYQANLTFPMYAEIHGTSEAIFAALKQAKRESYRTLVLQENGPDIISCSPELFFTLNRDGMIETKPMKGTQPRSCDPIKDKELESFLANDPKNRAENLMIVDLLRNDLSRICQPGSVKVPQLFEIESYSTVHQMTSQIVGQTKAGKHLSDIIRALFPCGSITGAPKVRAMEILNTLEPSARDVYCGSIGWAAPDRRAEFNVAIRTLMLESKLGQLNVGGGVIYDSTAESEYEEALWKARFAQRSPVIAA